MDPVTTAIVTVLGKYAIDKGASLVKEAGQAAADAAGKLFQKVIERLKADPAEARNAERFESNPEGYKQPVGDAVEEKMKADPDFAAQLKALLGEFDAAQKAAGVTIVTRDVRATASKGGAAIGSISLGGSASGDITVSGGNAPDQGNDTE